MKTIQLTQGMVATVDDEDFESLSKHSWYAKWDGEWYAARNTRGVKKRKTIRMHSEIMGSQPGQMVDHVDGDGLNNRRGNLRFCTYQQNGANTKFKTRSKTGFRGVRKHKDGLFTAELKDHGRTVSLGYFKRPHDAAVAYDDGARKMYGEFARLNFPNRRQNNENHRNRHCRGSGGEGTFHVS